MRRLSDLTETVDTRTAGLAGYRTGPGLGFGGDFEMGIEWRDARAQRVEVHVRRDDTML